MNLVIPVAVECVPLDALQQSWPHDPVHFDGGANDLTGESVSFGEIRVHGVGLILEQKETKATKRENRA